MLISLRVTIHFFHLSDIVIMGSDAGWKVEEPRENITIITKGFKKSSIVLQKSEGAMASAHPPSSEAMVIRATL